MILSFFLQFTLSISSVICNNLGSNILKCETIIFNYITIFLHNCNLSLILPDHLCNKFVYYKIVEGDKVICKGPTQYFPLVGYSPLKCVCNILYCIPYLSHIAITQTV